MPSLVAKESMSAQETTPGHTLSSSSLINSIYVEAFQNFIRSCLSLDVVALISKAIVYEDGGITVWDKSARALGSVGQA